LLTLPKNAPGSFLPEEIIQPKALKFIQLFWIPPNAFTKAWISVPSRKRGMCASAWWLQRQSGGRYFMRAGKIDTSEV
jgi:hypothetical protein